MKINIFKVFDSIIDSYYTFILPFDTYHTFVEYHCDHLLVRQSFVEFLDTTET